MILELAVIYTTRLDACRDFYRGIGLVLVPERHGNGPEHYAAMLDDGGVLELYPATGRPETGYLRLGLTAPPNGAGFLPPGRHAHRPGRPHGRPHRRGGRPGRGPDGAEGR